MTNPTWELVRIARTRAMADRLEELARDQATEGGNPVASASWYAYAFGWLAHEAARRIVELEDARGVPTPAQGAAAQYPPTPQGGGVPPLSLVPRASRK